MYASTLKRVALASAAARLCFDCGGPALPSIAGNDIPNLVYDELDPKLRRRKFRDTRSPYVTNRSRSKRKTERKTHQAQRGRR
jgi:hypothetical protein